VYGHRNLIQVAVRLEQIIARLRDRTALGGKALLQRQQLGARTANKRHLRGSAKGKVDGFDSTRAGGEREAYCQHRGDRDFSTSNAQRQRRNGARREGGCLQSMMAPVVVVVGRKGSLMIHSTCRYRIYAAPALLLTD
jgi:hypothetical protein